MQRILGGVVVFCVVLVAINIFVGGDEDVEVNEQAIYDHLENLIGDGAIIEDIQKNPQTQEWNQIEVTIAGDGWNELEESEKNDFVDNMAEIIGVYLTEYRAVERRETIIIHFYDADGNLLARHDSSGEYEIMN